MLTQKHNNNNNNDMIYNNAQPHTASRQPMQPGNNISGKRNDFKTTFYAATLFISILKFLSTFNFRLFFCSPVIFCVSLCSVHYCTQQQSQKMTLKHLTKTKNQPKRDEEWCKRKRNQPINEINKQARIKTLSAMHLTLTLLHYTRFFFAFIVHSLCLDRVHCTLF